jgi:DNA-binding LacI/PurR family transcriptional regulator
MEHYALFINHDAVTKGALVGLAERRVRFPEDVALLTHANRGDDFPTPCPLTRVEIDVDGLHAGCSSSWRSTAAVRGPAW